MSILGNIFKRKPKIKKQESFLELLCVILSCWLLSVGTGLVLDSQFTITIGLSAILWQTLAATVAMFLLTRRWWIPIIYFGILIPVFFIAVSASGDLISFFKSVASFFGWWFGGMPIESKWYTNQGYYLIHTCMNVGVSIMYFAIARITKKAWISVIVALAFIVSNYAFGYTGYDVVTIPFFVVGIFPLIAGEKFQNINLPEFKNMFGVLGKKWLMIFVSTFIAVIVSITSLFVLSNTKGSVRTRFCSDIVADVQTATDTFTIEQQKVNVTLFDLGLVMNSTYIGGNLYEIEPEVIATTDLKKPTRIKLTTYDKYNGQNWVGNFEKSYRINSIFWKEEQNNFLSTRLLDDEEFMDDIENIAFKNKVTFTMKKNTNFLPTMGQVIGFEEKTHSTNPITFDSRGRLISYYGQKKNYSYTIESLVYDSSQEITERQMNGILGDYAFKKDPNYNKNSEFYKRYTESLGELPKEAKKAMKSLADKDYNEYQIAYNISNYFIKNEYAYVKKPATFNKGDSVIEKLFSTKHGHCMYYATTMIAMAREAGIPSRLAVGYVTIPGTNKKTQVVDASSPYAWVECYMPNVGWISFDPSPQNPQSLSSSNFQESANVSNKDDMPDIEVETEEEEEETGGTALKWDTKFNWSLIISLAILLILIIAVIIHTVTSQGYYKIDRVRKRYKSTTKQAKFYYADILRQYAWLGFRLRRGQTISEATEEVCTTLSPNYKEAVVKAITVIEAMHYGDEAPEDTQVADVAKARNLLENVLKDKNSFFMYIIKRRLLLPTVSPKTFKKLKK